MSEPHIVIPKARYEGLLAQLDELRGEKKGVENYDEIVNFRDENDNLKTSTPHPQEENHHEFKDNHEAHDNTHIQPPGFTDSELLTPPITLQPNSTIRLKKVKRARKIKDSNTSQQRSYKNKSKVTKIKKRWLSL